MVSGKALGLSIRPVPRLSCTRRESSHNEKNKIPPLKPYYGSLHISVAPGSDSAHVFQVQLCDSRSGLCPVYLEHAVKAVTTKKNKIPPLTQYYGSLNISVAPDSDSAHVCQVIWCFPSGENTWCSGSCLCGCD